VSLTQVAGEPPVSDRHKCAISFISTCFTLSGILKIFTNQKHATDIMRSAVAVILLLCAASASAYPLIWAGISQDCSAIPANGYGPHEAPAADE
jgi:hypothetical protein